MAGRGNEFLDSGFDKLNGGFWDHFLNAITGENKKDKAFSVFFFFLLMTYAGVEFVKIIFRSNFGKRGLSSAKLIFVGVALAIVVILALISYNETASAGWDWVGDEITALTIVIVYGLLILVVAIKGFIEKGKPVNSEGLNYRGDSTILSFLVKQGWKSSTVQNLAEPLFLAAIGVALLPTSMLLGGPLIIFSISYWLHLFAERMMNFHAARDRLTDESQDEDEEFTNAK